MKSSTLRIILPFVFLALAGGGCVIGVREQTASEGGLFRSADRGDAWEHPVALPTAKGVGSIAGTDVIAIAFDPSDPKAVYLGTATNGMLYSYDGGTSWMQAAGLSAGRVPAVAVDPKDKCTIYAAQGNRVLKSLDCNRSFQIAYVDSRPEAVINTLVVDWFRPVQIYAGTETGEVIRSADAGASWAVLQRFDDPVRKVVMSSRDSRMLLVGQKGRGLMRTTDAGETWTDISRGLDPFPGSRAFFDLVEVPTDDRTFILAARFGLLRTTDAGETWHKIEILTPPEAVTVTALAVNPRNGAELYYGTANTLYRSMDGGSSWVTKKLPTTRAATALAVDPTNGNVLYLGVSKLQK